MLVTEAFHVVYSPLLRTNLVSGYILPMVSTYAFPVIPSFSSHFSQPDACVPRRLLSHAAGGSPTHPRTHARTEGERDIHTPHTHTVILFPTRTECQNLQNGHQNSISYFPSLLISDSRPLLAKRFRVQCGRLPFPRQVCRRPYGLLMAASVKSSINVPALLCPA